MMSEHLLHRAKGSAFKVVLGTFLLLGAACGTLGPVTDSVQYVTLRPEARAELPADAKAVRLVSVRVPDYMDGRKVAVREGSVRVDFINDALWVEPLRDAVDGSLRAHLRAHGVDARRDAGDQTVTVAVDVERMDAFADGSLRMEAAWVLRAPGQPGDFHRFNADGQWTSGDLDSLALAWSELLSELASAIADSLAGSPERGPR